MFDDGGRSRRRFTRVASAVLLATAPLFLIAVRGCVPDSSAGEDRAIESGAAGAEAKASLVGAVPAELGFEIRRVEVGTTTASVLVMDVDDDGVEDLVVSGGRRVTVLRGDGTGGFAVAEAVEAGEHPVDLAAGDLDGDGRPDLVVANHETDYVTLLFAGPDGFAPGRSERVPVGVSPHPHAVAIDDLDRDGRLDFVVDDRDGERLGIFRGLGRGEFRPAAAIPVGGDPYRGMVLDDLDGDGHTDVVTPNPRSVAVQLGDGSGDFSPGPELPSGGLRPFSVAVGDFNGDGAADVAAGSGEGPGAVAAWWGSGGGAFEAAPGSPYRIAGGPTALTTGDVDGDGVEDLVVTSYLGDELTVLLGGEAGFRVHRVGLSDRPWGAAAGDLNGDGRLDLVTANDGGTRISVLLARGG